jgi:hypothetical protein
MPITLLTSGFVDELLKIAAFNTSGLSPETVLEKGQPPPPMETPGFDKARNILGRATQTKTASRRQSEKVQRALPMQPGIGKLTHQGDSSAPEQAKSVAGYGLAGIGAGGALHKVYTATAPGVHDSMRNPLHGSGARFAAEAKNNRLARNLMVGGAAAGAVYGGYRALKKSRDARMAKQGTLTKLSTIPSPGLALKASQQVGKAKVSPSSSGPSTTTQIRGQLIGKKGIP